MLGQSINFTLSFFSKAVVILVLLFNKEEFNWSKVTVKTFIVLQKKKSQCYFFFNFQFNFRDFSSSLYKNMNQQQIVFNTYVNKNFYKKSSTMRNDMTILFNFFF